MRRAFIVVALGFACTRPDPRDQIKTAGVCATPRSGLVVSPDSVGPFSTHASLSELEQRCSSGADTLYDAVGWQAVGRMFPFNGAQLVAVQSQRSFGETLQDSVVPDLWTATGDSLRLPDGQFLPRTLGELRSRYGRAIVDDVLQGDDIDGPHARSCRFPTIEFTLAATALGKVPDTARITGVEMWVSRRVPDACPP